MGDKWTRMQLIADAADGMTTEQAVKYLKHGAEMESLIKLVCSQIASLIRWHPDALTLQRFSKEPLTKLEEGN